MGSPMGVCFTAFTVKDEKIDRVLKEPPLILRLYDPESVAQYLAEIGANKKPGLFAKLFGAKEVKPPDPLPSFKFDDGEKSEIDLDKSWDGINYCLKKRVNFDFPNIFEDGVPVGRVEVGYGPAMCFKSDQVSKMASGLEYVPDQELLATYTPSDMTGVYPSGLWREESAEVRRYLIDNYNLLRNFVIHAAENHLGIVVIFT